MKFAKSTRIGSSGCIIPSYARMEAHGAQMISDPQLTHVDTRITCRVSLAVQAQERCMRNNDRWCRRSEDPNLDSCSAYQRKATRLPERQYRRRITQCGAGNSQHCSLPTVITSPQYQDPLGMHMLSRRRSPKGLMDLPDSGIPKTR